METLLYCAVSFGVGICFAAYCYEKTINQLEHEIVYLQLKNIL
jgi:hypothetical protein